MEALRTFTLSVVRNRGNVDDNAVQAFLDAGFTRRQILEVILGVSQKVMSNYTNRLANTPVDAPFVKFDWQKVARPGTAKAKAQHHMDAEERRRKTNFWRGRMA